MRMARSLHRGNSGRQYYAGTLHQSPLPLMLQVQHPGLFLVTKGIPTKHNVCFNLHSLNIKFVSMQTICFAIEG